MYGDWPSNNPMPERHAIALFRVIGHAIDPMTCIDASTLLRMIVDEDAVDAILSTCTMATCASRLLPREGHLDYDDAVLRAAGLPLIGRVGQTAAQFLHLNAKLNGGVNADPRPLLETNYPLTVAEVGVAVTIGYLRTCAEVLEAPIREVFSALLEDVWKLHA